MFPVFCLSFKNSFIFEESTAGVVIFFILGRLKIFYDKIYVAYIIHYSL